jgi:hypothetical protein
MTDLEPSAHGGPPTTPAPLLTKKILEPPERVTFGWLFQNVPVSMWLAAAGVLATIFTAGFSTSRIPLVQQLLDLTAASLDAPADDRGALVGEIHRRIAMTHDVLTKIEHDDNWPLATWAKMHWSIKTLDGDPPFPEQYPQSATPSLSNLKIMVLLARLYPTLPANSQKLLLSSIEGLQENIIQMSSSYPDQSSSSTEDKNIEAVRKFRNYLETAYGFLG